MTYTEHYIGSVVYVAQLDGQTLYVGQTHRDIRDRIREHRMLPWWRPDVTYVVHPCRTTVDACILEARLVAELDPPHNVYLSDTNRKAGRLPRGAAQVAAYRALREADHPLTTTQLRQVTGIRNVGSTIKRLGAGGVIVCVGKNSTPEHGRRQSVWALAEWSQRVAS